MNMPPPSRPSVLQLALKEKGALYAAYIPLFANGGIFVATNRQFRLGDDVYVLLTLLDDPERYTIEGKVAWVTPKGPAGHRTQGIGVCFAGDEKSVRLKARIEQILGAALGADRATQTV